jgi:thiol-disulfide isomerase/thioredoxin
MGHHPLRLFFVIGLALLAVTGGRSVANGQKAAQAVMAPDFTVTTLDGKKLRLQDQTGKVVLLDFWGVWCGPCREVVPDLVSVYERHVNEPFVIIGISSDSPGNAGQLRDFVSMNRMKWPQVHDLNQDVIHTYAVNVYPTYVLIDGDGVERGRFDGKSSVKNVETEIRKWLKTLAASNARKERAAVPSATIAAPSTSAAARWRLPADLAPSALLERAGRYLEAYEKQISMVVAEELYMQTSQVSSGGGAQTRTLKSDVLVVDLGTGGWTGFRDVFEVDGQPIRDHQNRLLAIVMSPSPDPLTQARRMADEGARFNLGAVARTINMPTVALKFLRSIEQGRSSWKAGARKKIDGHEVVELVFAEQDTPRRIATSDQAAARGRFWVEEPTGRIVRSELAIETMGVSATVTVTFGPTENLLPWVPLRLDDEYRPVNQRSPSYGPSGVGVDSSQQSASWGPGARIDGHATYGKFRTFDVTSNTVIRKQ